MRLSELIAGLGASGGDGAEDPFVSAIACDSREAMLGSLFVCIPGGDFDGHDFAGRAVAQGAVAVVAERPIPSLGVPLLLVPSTREALAILALRLAGDPQEELRLVGITGTNGKTTVGFLLASILSAAGKKAGLIGTVGSWAGGEKIEDMGLTTPGPIPLARTLQRMVEAGCDGAVMEVSSHALEQGRVRGLQFSAAAFTNLSRDHLDYHGDMESYFEAKARLFRERLALGAKVVVNVDDAYGRRLATEVERPMRFSMEDRGAELHALSWRSELMGIDATLQTPAGSLRLRSPLIGRHNVENLLCAAGLGLALGISLKAIEQGLASSSGAPGRMERVEGGEVSVFVDYAHTDAALRLALQALRDAEPRRLIVVFGCGGDRDVGKRPLMGEAAAAADLVIVTSDNPRTEDPLSIVKEILPGLESAGKIDYVVELDRRKAIREAIAAAEPGDAVLIAGKGHEDYQIVGTEKRPFDDREEARRALREAAR